MTTNDSQSTTTATAPQGVKPHRLIKLGVDVHWRQYVVVRQIDGASPQPPQRFTPEEFVAWAKKQTQLGDEVHCCYEAGPFGFVLHKRLVALGVKSRVVRPRNWDEYSKKGKANGVRQSPTDKILNAVGIRGTLRATGFCSRGNGEPAG
jgi:hypothetical protein